MTRILVADDHAVVREGVRKVLEDAFTDLQVGEAKDGHEALRMYRDSDWDAVVLDIALPERSGIEVLKDIKAGNGKTPVLILSVHPEEQYAVRALRMGAAGYLHKDSAPEELQAAVRRVIEGGTYVSSSLAERLALRLQDDAEGPAHERLSDREMQVLCMLADGKTVSDIAEELYLSVKTISTYRARLLEKMDMSNNAELIRYAIEHDLAGPS
ncbi:MAG: response regulator [Planctomycetota bacterium]